jgi:hypothetical protein
MISQHVQYHMVRRRALWTRILQSLKDHGDGLRGEEALWELEEAGNHEDEDCND